MPQNLPPYTTTYNFPSKNNIPNELDLQLSTQNTYFALLAPMHRNYVWLWVL